jgi:drug/metabolite transporter (DMT)-like permease
MIRHGIVLLPRGISRCASIALVVFALLTRMRMPALRDVPLVFLLWLVGFAFYNLALNYGEARIPAGPASVLIQTAPIWTALAAVLFLRERLGTRAGSGSR